MYRNWIVTDESFFLTRVVYAFYNCEQQEGSNHLGTTAERGFQLNMRESRSSESAGGYVQRFRGESEYPDRGGGDSEGIQKYKEEEN